VKLAVSAFDDQDTLNDDTQHTELPTVRNGKPGRPASVPHDGRFELGELLGRGGMGEVRLAHDPRIGRDVAVKLMHGDTDAGAVARFFREARVQGRLDHPAVVPVYDLDVDERGAPYFAMKRLTGITLSDVLARRARGELEAMTRWTQRLLLARLVDVCLAIEFAHSRGVIHRDLKPANIMLGDFGEAYVLDWGIARLLDVDLPTDRRIARTGLDSIDVGKTADGAQVGTPGYMPPEQVLGLPVDGRADVYALGCILFEILTDRPVLPRDSTVFRVTLATLEHRPSERHPELDVPPELDELCGRATAADRQARLGSPGQLAAALQRFLDGDRDGLRRQQLATEYADAAGQAFEAGDRTLAMRSAGRALALDPDNQRAQQLVGHLLLAPVDVPPAEVERELAIDNLRAGRIQLRSAVVACALFLLAMPTVFWLGVRRPGWVFALIAGILANGIAFLFAASRERPVGRWLYVGLTLHCGTLALAGFVLGPLLVVPTLAVGSVAGFLSQPMVWRRLPVIGAHLLAVLAPFVLEVVGVVPRTFSIDAGDLRLHPWAVDMPPHVLLIVALVAAVLQIIATSILVIQLRRAKDAAERTTKLQLWHLRQLVPAPSPRSESCPSPVGARRFRDAVRDRARPRHDDGPGR
jgi:serine/threonine-protein kinase